jgi:hypothetical protein
VDCFNENNGSIDLTVFGGTSPYTYDWDNDGTGDNDDSQDLADLDGGVYSVTVTDNNGCSATISVFIAEPNAPLILTEIHTDVDCFDDNDGTIDLTVSGGTNPYTYDWDNDGTGDNDDSQDLNNLSGGIYNVTVIDNNGCTGEISVTIVEPATELTLTETHTDIQCFGMDNGSIDLTVIGGTSPYTYDWDNDGSEDPDNDSQDLINLAGSIYTVTVTDDNGCTGMLSITIEEPGLLTCSAEELSPVICFGENSGSAEATPDGGIGPYTYLWDNGETTQIALTLSAGVHQVTITDINDCTTSCDVTINGPEEFSCSITIISEIVCEGDSSGVAIVEMTNGVEPFTFLWDNGEITQTASALTQGQHSVTVTDNNGCQTSCIVDFNDPNEFTCSIEIDDEVLCFGDTTGVATAVPAGGVAPFTFLWNTGQTTQTADSLMAGLYTVTITDDLGCTSSCEVQMDQPFTFRCPVSIQQFPTCYNTYDGIATVVPSGGSGGETYMWDNGDTTQTSTIIGPGTHFVTVTDVNNCECLATVFMIAPDTVPAVDLTVIECENEEGKALFDLRLNDSDVDTTGKNMVSYHLTMQNALDSVNPFPDTIITNDKIIYARVVDSTGCVNTAEITLVSRPCYCTLTQEQWDDPIHELNKQMVWDIVDSLFNLNGSLTIGQPGNSLTIQDPECLFNLLPSYDNPSDLPDIDVNVEFPECDPKPIPAYPDGRLKNSLATQAIALTLNIWLDSTFCYQDLSEAAICIPEIRNEILDALPEDSNICDLLSLANSELAGANDYPYTGTLFDLVIAIDSLNSYFNNCGVFYCDESQIDLQILAENGIISNVTTDWDTITLENYYHSMIVVATPVVPDTQYLPVVTRIKNAEGNSFEIMVQNPDVDPVGKYDIHYLVVEEGVYDSLRYGIKLEALKTLSQLTAGSFNWIEENQSYQNFYDDPVILGQVMSYNDDEWSVFWANGQNINNPPDSSYFKGGKHVGEDVITVRDNETIGYVILEEGNGVLANKNYYAGLGSNIVQGTENTDTGYIYTALNLETINSAVLSSAGMKDNDGGWPVLFTETPLYNDTLTLAIDEDQITDDERLHGQENVAYIAFETIDIKAERETVKREGRKISNSSKEEEATIIINPNPFENVLNVRVQSDIHTEATIIIFDLNRTLFIERTVPTNSVSQFNSQEWNSGMYLVNISIGNNSIWRKIVKVSL